MSVYQGREMWMGPRGNETWVRTPSAGGGTFMPVGWSTRSQRLNGSAGVRTSRTTHMEYAMSFPLMSRVEARKITDMYSGKRGPGAIFVIDPMQADLNVLPEHWSFPAQAGYDAPPLVGNVRPQRVVTPASDYDFPYESARYTVKAGDTSRKLYIPIPRGYTAWVGFAGDAASSGRVLVKPVRGEVAVGTATALAALSVEGSARFNHAVPHGDASGVEISIDATPGTFTLYGLMLQILPNGFVPQTQSFITGRGNSGLKFDGAPSETPIELHSDKVSLSAKLTEVWDAVAIYEGLPTGGVAGWRPDPANPGYLLP